MDLDKLFEKIPYDRLIPIPAWQRMAAMAGVSVLVLALFYFVVARGQDTQIVKLEASLAKIEKEVDDNRRQARKMDELKVRMRLLEAKLKEASKQLPTEKEIPELLEQVSNIGTQAGLEFVTFKPLAEVKQDFYSQVPVDMKITGKFHNILMFFDEIARLPRIVTINNIKMNSGKKEGPTNLTVKCQAITYRFLGKPKAEKKATKAKRKGGGKRT